MHQPNSEVCQTTEVEMHLEESDKKTGLVSQVWN